MIKRGVTSTGSCSSLSSAQRKVSTRDKHQSDLADIAQSDREDDGGDSDVSEAETEKADTSVAVVKRRVTSAGSVANVNSRPVRWVENTGCLANVTIYLMYPQIFYC